MFEVGRRNEVALAVMATATASRPGSRPWRWAARRATGIATTTATSRLTIALSTAVKARMAAADATMGPRPGTSALARTRNTPMRPASADATMIAARVANGPAVAHAVAAVPSGRSVPARAARTPPNAHTVTRTGSRDDVILAVSLVSLIVMRRVLTTVYWGIFFAKPHQRPGFCR